MSRVAGDIYGGALRDSPELVRKHLSHVRVSSYYGSRKLKGKIETGRRYCQPLSRLCSVINMTTMAGLLNRWGRPIVKVCIVASICIVALMIDAGRTSAPAA